MQACLITEQRICLSLHVNVDDVTKLKKEIRYLTIVDKNRVLVERLRVACGQHRRARRCFLPNPFSSRGSGRGEQTTPEHAASMPNPLRLSKLVFFFKKKKDKSITMTGSTAKQTSYLLFV